jgi:hypothetical protein
MDGILCLERWPEKTGWQSRLERWMRRFFKLLFASFFSAEKNEGMSTDKVSIISNPPGICLDP